MEETLTEIENLGICVWKVFNSHLLVLRSSCHFLLSRQAKFLIYGDSRNNHKGYFTRCLLEVLCYLCSMKLVCSVANFEFIMTCWKSFLLLLRCLMMSETAKVLMHPRILSLSATHKATRMQRLFCVIPKPCDLICFF